MTTKANAIHHAKRLARQRQETVYVVYDPEGIDEPPDLSYYAASAAEVDTYYAGCTIVDAIEPEDIVS